MEASSPRICAHQESSAPMPKKNDHPGPRSSQRAALLVMLGSTHAVVCARLPEGRLGGRDNTGALTPES